MSISYRYQGTASTAHRGMVETNELKKVNFKRTYGQISNVTVCKNFSTIYLCLQTNPSTSTGKRKKKGVSRVPWNQTLITEWVSLPEFRFVWLRNDRSMSHIWPSMVWVPQFKLLRGCWSELPFGCKSLMVLNCWLLLPWHVRNWLTTTSTSWWELFLWLLIWTLLFGCKSLMNHDSNQLVGMLLNKSTPNAEILAKPVSAARSSCAPCTLPSAWPSHWSEGTVSFSSTRISWQLTEMRSG